MKKMKKMEKMKKMKTMKTMKKMKMKKREKARPDTRQSSRRRFGRSYNAKTDRNSETARCRLCVRD